VGSRDPVVVDAVAGLGEALVGGRAAHDHYRVTRQGKVITRDLAGKSPVLSDEELARLVREALTAEGHWGEPLDMEWAIDGKGELFWLQARPVTALEGDVHEFDHGHGPDDVYTRSNIGEMIPGAVTPLTLSTTVFGIDQGIQAMQQVCGARKRTERELQTLGVFCGHLFFNLTAMLDFCNSVGGSSPRTLALAIVGRAVPELGEGDPAPRLARALNGIRYLRYVLAGQKKVEALMRRLDSFSLGGRDRAADMYGDIDGAMPLLVEATIVHLQSSAASGMMAGVLEGIAARGRVPTAKQEAAVAALLAGAGQVESADLVRELDRVTQTVAAHKASPKRFCGVRPGEALAWLEGEESGEAGRAFRRFLRRHGHRSFRELSMRQPCWEDDPIPLVISMQASAAGLRHAPARGRKGVVERTAAEDLPVPAFARSWLKARSQAAVRHRERSKSMLVDVTNRFKRAYRRLSDLLVEEGRLPEAELMYFLTHDEIGRLVGSPDPVLAAKAAGRRSAYDRQKGLEFPPIFQGRPLPMEPAPAVPDGELALAGKPVSRGVVEGTARVVRTLEEAAAIRPGEILIAPITDVGWTPYFNLIAGIATDLGSVISHGAVIAREYGLPAVVNLKTATRTFRTGDRVILDGDRGMVRRIVPVEQGGRDKDEKETASCLQNSMS
jgi:phosphohistidine swiveling domain-containing protein